MRRVRLFLPPVLVLACLVALAQSARAAASSLPAPAQISLGESAVTLAGPWKFTPGDSPQANGSLLWAGPAYDDSAWAAMDLHAKPGAIDAAYGNSGYVTGWSARGFPHLAGYAWYRLRVHIVSASGPLWLKMPNHTDDSYQVYANGQYVGEFGHFTGNNVRSYRSRSLAFPLPAPDANGNILLALRFYEEPSVLVTGSTGDSGGMHQAPLLGLRAQVESARNQEVTERILSIIVPVFVTFLMLIAAAASFRIWLLDRPRTTYLWLTFGLLFAAAGAPVLVTAYFTLALQQRFANVLIQFIPILSLVCWAIFWRQWFNLKRNRWVTFGLITLPCLALATQSFADFAVHTAPRTILTIMELGSACSAALGVMLFVILLQGARKDRIGALAALPPVLLLIISIFSTQLIAWFHIRTSFFPFGIQVGVKDVAMALLVLVVGALAARRFLNSQVAQRLDRQAVEQEMEQARELQQHVLTPETISSPLFTVETAYHPARTVGGDFFQVISHADGSLLLVIGDVSGKGIAAAMLVAVLVGAIRTLADQNTDPAAILNSLNDRLLNRAGGHFATCIAAHISPTGSMRIANAGHIPPYRNGVELPLHGSIPLGLVPGAQYETSAVQLQPSDHLTFLTDGVLEARNSAGHLLGFEQMEKISALPAEIIAQTAIDHGQDDDITVVSVRLQANKAALQNAPLLEASPL